MDEDVDTASTSSSVVVPLMPYGPVTTGKLTVDDADEDGTSIDIYYEVHTLRSRERPRNQECLETTPPTKGQPKAIRMTMIMGFAAAGQAWTPLLHQLFNLWAVPEGVVIEALLIDNRGIGKSTFPKSKKCYSTKRMAMDALAVMDHLGWHQCHVLGFSMGGMVSIKLAAMAPHRVQTCALISVTAGGAQVLPRKWKALKYAFKACFSANDAVSRADMDLRFHFTKKTLKRVVPHLGVSVREVLREEYLATATSSPPQPPWAFKGQAHAVWTHSVTEQDVRSIRSAGFPVWFLHGRHDLVAMPEFAEQLAAKFAAPCVYVDGAHFIPRENAVELALLIRSLVCLGGGVASPLAAAAAAPGFTAYWALDGLALNLDVRAGLPATGRSDVMHRGLVAATAEKVHQQHSSGCGRDPEPEERPILR